MEARSGGSNKEAFLFTFVLLHIFVYLASATEITIPLPGLTGSVPKSTGFDFGVSFENINSVTIHCIGNITPGLGQGDGVERPVYPQFEWPAEMVFYSDPGPGYYSTHFGPYDGLFDEAKPFKKMLGATWESLLDGQGEIETYLSPAIVIGGEVVIPPQGSVSGAYITIKGTVVFGFITPANDEFIPQGTVCSIQWEDSRSPGNCSGNYLLEYSVNDGNDWQQVDANLMSGTCSYDWTVPVVDSNNCFLRITDVNDANFTDVSDRFTIYQCQQSFTADLNKDCYIDLLDFALFADEWALCGNPYDPLCGD